MTISHSGDFHCVYKTLIDIYSIVGLPSLCSPYTDAAVAIKSFGMGMQRAIEQSLAGEREDGACKRMTIDQLVIWHQVCQNQQL